MNGLQTIEYLNNYRKKIFALVQHSLIIRNFFIYAFGHIILRSVSFIVMPFALRMLAPDEYGLLSLAISFANIFIVFLSLGFRQVFALEYFHHDEAGQKIILNDILILFLCVSIPILCLLACDTSVINSLVFMGQACPMLIRITLLFCFFYYFSELFYQIMQYQCKAFELTLLQSSAALITICCNIIFLYCFNCGACGMMLGYVIGLLFTCSIGAYHYIKKRYFLTINIKQSISRLFYYGVKGFPFIPQILLSLVLSYGSRLMLARYGTMHDVGIYALADTFSSLYQMLIIYPLSCSYLPLLFARYASNKENILPIERWNKRTMWLSMIVMLVIIAFGYPLCKPIALKLLPIKYHEALNYGCLILMGNIFLMGVTFASCLIQFHKKTYFLMVAVCIPALLNILLNMVLIPQYNLYGCSIASAFSYACYFAIILAYSTKLEKKANLIS